MVKKLIKEIKLVHVLLAILILVVFLGLFKSEVNEWSNSNLPRERLRLITTEYACKVKEENPDWTEKNNKIHEDCYATNSGNFTGTISCTYDARNKLTIPQYMELNSTCTNEKREMWLSAFGIHLFKTRNAIQGKDWRAIPMQMGR